jgi:Helicase associated domain
MGRHSTLTDAREQELEKLGFVWNSHRAAWEERFEDLKLFFLRNGHCNVPSNYDADKLLAVWVKCQRRQMKLYKKGLACTMTRERMEALESLGFDWNPRNL